MELGGLHHVTAVTGDAAGNVAFYTQVLGLRLVKKTVNQDDVSAYHLFYGDVLGHPGTEVTFFDWPHIGPALRGTQTIALIALRVPDAAALRWWARRLEQAGIAYREEREWDARPALTFTDPEGQALRLVADAQGVAGTPWPASPVPSEVAIRGLHAVTLCVADATPTADVLRDVLGFRQVGSYPVPDNTARPVQVWAVGAGGSGAEVHLEERPELPPGRVGIGGVHHVALRTPDAAQQQAWRERIHRAGLDVTPVIDRYYFRSIYFHVPGQILFEIATDGPGFATDEDPEHLGERLALPPFLEPRRAAIERGLRPL